MPARSCAYFIRKRYPLAESRWGPDIAIRTPIPESLRLELAYFSGVPWLRGRRTGGAGVILRFERVRPRRSARFQPLKSSGNHARISRPDDPGAEALEIRHRLAGRGVPQGGHAGRAETVRLPDIRRRLQGSDHIGLSRAFETWRSLHGLRADGVSGWPGRGLVARARGSDCARAAHQPRDGSQGAAFRYRNHVGKIPALRISRGLDALARAAGSLLRDQGSLHAILGRPRGLSREASMDWDDLAKACGRSAM